VSAIWIKRSARGPMDPVDRAVLRAGAGIVGNADQGGRRQVTLMDRDRWTALMGELGADVDPSVRRANLMIDGVSLEGSRDRILRVGRCRLHVRGETKPCNRMDEALPGLRLAMTERWGGGAFAEVLDDGEIAVGDPVAWSEPGGAGSAATEEP
jgi:MOSC domain-containing protein YiiM